MIRKNLVVVRAGPQSLHESWLGPCTRSFDIVVSYYDRNAFEQDETSLLKFYIPGGKWDGLAATFARLDLARYEYVWLPDDDISATASDIESLFHYAKQCDFSVCQPALTHDSYFSHFLLVACEDFDVRFTNYVEIMMPCLHRRILQKVLPHFSSTMSGFGLDYIWTRLEDENRYRAGIIDDVAMRHTRPVGSALRQFMRSLNRTPKEEEQQLRKQFGVDGLTRPLAYAGVRRDGRRTEGRFLMGFAMAACQIRALSLFRDRGKAVWAIWRTFRRQMTRRPEFDRLVETPLQQLPARQV